MKSSRVYKDQVLHDLLTASFRMHEYHSSLPYQPSGCASKPCQMISRESKIRYIHDEKICVCDAKTPLWQLLQPEDLITFMISFTVHLTSFMVLLSPVRPAPSFSGASLPIRDANTCRDPRTAMFAGPRKWTQATWVGGKAASHYANNINSSVYFITALANITRDIPDPWRSMIRSPWSMMSGSLYEEIITHNNFTKIHVFTTLSHPALKYMDGT